MDATSGPARWIPFDDRASATDIGDKKVALVLSPNGYSSSLASADPNVKETVHSKLKCHPFTPHPGVNGGSGDIY